MRKIKLHIIHCSDSPQGRGDNAKTIDKWHRARGWNGCGYHFVILEDGTIEFGRSLLKSGAHAKGYNQISIGTCLIGIDYFTEAQFKSLRFLDKLFKIQYNCKTIPHNEVNKNKSCPNFDVYDVLKGQ